MRLGKQTINWKNNTALLYQFQQYDLIGEQPNPNGIVTFSCLCLGRNKCRCLFCVEIMTFTFVGHYSIAPYRKHFILVDLADQQEAVNGRRHLRVMMSSLVRVKRELHIHRKTSTIDKLR
ncbi:hypothetical protein TNIN_336361 [Trichonephila inaurata madagascariensis]|uniref:Uncharacterized protein n=1 Tax=Trichonephila inaurata madagascariensis TaxID=2747483 RepID=A0A8X6WXJ7_9ARAC|nr:hypothetical protein TNIN_336361 [Trichonephila inaurata madagascariensis]